MTAGPVPGADVVVVGGGVIGCATAFELSVRGARVTLIERADLAAGASGRNHGLLLTPLDPALLEMARHSREVYGSAVQDSPLPVALDPAPIGFLIMAGEDRAEREGARAEAEAAAAAGVPVERVTGEQAHALEPSLSPELAEGWLLEDARRIDPAALTVALALLARERGATVERGLTARAVAFHGDRAAGVVTDAGLVEAATVVIAAGPWTAPLLRRAAVDVPVLGFRGWLVQLRPSRTLSRLVGRAGWHVLPEHESVVPIAVSDVLDADPAGPAEPPGSLLQPNPDGTLLAGGSRHAAVTNEPEDPSMPRRILEQAVRLVPSMRSAEVLSAWWGIRPMTPDGRPLVGEVGPGLIVAAGHGSQGVILGGGTGRLVASMALGEPEPFDRAPFDPARFG